jgi:hypothetical protein
MLQSLMECDKLIFGNCPVLIVFCGTSILLFCIFFSGDGLIFLSDVHWWVVKSPTGVYIAV